MRKFLVSLLLSVVGLLSPAAARAQFLGYTSPQSVQATLAPAGTACTSLPQTYLIPNFGQTNHIATLFPSGTQTTLSMQILGIDQSGNATIISDTLLGAAPGSSTTANQIIASGYYPTTEVVITCAPITATYRIDYSGTSSTFPLYAGGLLGTQVDKSLALAYSASSAGGKHSFNVGAVPPFGNQEGELVFEYSATGPSGSILSVNCVTGTGVIVDQRIFNLSTVGLAPQVFQLPPLPCVNLVVGYTGGALSVATFNLDYFFTLPGFTQNVGTQNVNITSKTTTEVKGIPGILKSIVVNTSAAGTIGIYDITGAGCASTPASGLLGTITLAGTEPPSAILYNLAMTQGICIVTSGTPDLTVTYQ
jgi:hypothetical protein